MEAPSFWKNVEKITRVIQRQKVWLGLVGGVVVGLGLGLLIGWWWWPLEWYDARPGDLHSNFRDEYFLWVAEQYALTSDLEGARDMLGVDSEDNGKIAENLKVLALRQDSDDAVRVMVLAMALESTTQGSLSGVVSEECPSCGPFLMFGLPLILVVGVAGGGILIMKGLHTTGNTHTIADKAAVETWVGISGIGVSSMGTEYEQRSRLAGLYRFLSSWQNVLALTIIGLFVIVALAAPWLAPQEDPEDPSYFRIAEVNGRSAVTIQVPLPPGPGIPLGTVPGGLDVYYSLIWGVRPALRFGLTVALVTAFIGIVVGAISGYMGGRINSLTMRVTDAFLAFPAIAGVFLFYQVMSFPRPEEIPTLSQRLMMSLNLEPLVLALILFSWMSYARIINSNIVKLKQSEYAMAATTLGVGHSRIVFRHLLPNAIAPAIVLVARDIGSMVVLEAAFTFIGLSSGLPWGVILVTGRDWIIGTGGSPLTYWWTFLPVTLTLILFGIGWNLLGDGLNDVMDPRSLAHKVN